MFADHHKYLNGQRGLSMTYPNHEYFNEPIEHSFDFDVSIRLWVILFDISPAVAGGLRIKWQKVVH